MFQYVYNDIGNITSVITTPKNGSSSTTTFGYDTTTDESGNLINPDRLVSYNGKTIGYNSIGCPTSYDGKTYTWTNGKLTGISYVDLSSKVNSYNYAYNAFGQRVEKSFTLVNTSRIQPPVGGFDDTLIAYVKNSNTKYFYDHFGRLLSQYCIENYSDFTQTSTKLDYLYDESGMIGFKYIRNGVDKGAFYYQRNLQGDVVAIYNTSASKIVEYAYDAFGNCTVASSTTDYDLAIVNPIRYRGYYFDQESGWYFLNARYYSPEWRRFISPDDTAYLNPESVNGLNLYCYCGNDPINFVDPSGHFLITLGIIGFFATAVAGVVLMLGTVTVYTMIFVSNTIKRLVETANGFAKYIKNDMTFSDVHDSIGAESNGSQESSNIKNLYELYGGPGKDLTYAIYDEYGLDLD